MKYEKGNFITIPNKVILRKLSLGARAVFLEICDFADERGECFPSLKILAERCLCSEDSIQRYIKELIEAGILKKTTRKREDGGYTSNSAVFIIG